MKWVSSTSKHPSGQVEWDPGGERPHVCDLLLEPGRPDFWGSQGEDIEQLGEPALHLPVPRACARLCDPTQRAAAYLTPTLRQIKVYSSWPSPSLCVFGPKEGGGWASI